LVKGKFRDGAKVRKYRNYTVSPYSNREKRERVDVKKGQERRERSPRDVGIPG